MNDRKQQAAEIREDVMEKVAEMADRDLHDTRFDAWRSVSNRRRLVIATVVVLLIYGFSNYFEQPIITLLALLAYFALLWLMRIVSRNIPDLPDELVDERMREVRGTVYRHAYLGTVGLLTVAILIDIGLSLASEFTTAQRLTGTQWFDLMFFVFFATLAVPNAIFLWNEPEI
ncbi:MAG: hypothetical protein AAFX44_02450 [Pseudomonadota bacterium]